MWNRTIVSAFILGRNRNRSADEYLRFAKGLLEAKCPKILFIDRVTMLTVEPLVSEGNLTKIIVIDPEDFYLSKKATEHSCPNFCEINGNKEKDTLQYFILMCNKTEFVREAVATNPFGTEGFVWVDFGMKHVCPELSDEEYSALLESLASKPLFEEELRSVRIARIWDLEQTPSKHLLHDVQWYFAGGVFGGTAATLIEFADKTRAKCLQIIREHGLLTWEVNVWYQVWLENKELFFAYHNWHDVRLLTNY